jgi:hypothetical protein
MIDHHSRPLIGGLLARPADRWPHTLGKLIFFSQYPYFLPCITAAFVSVSAFLLASILLKEVCFLSSIGPGTIADKVFSLQTLPSNLRQRKIFSGIIKISRQVYGPELPGSQCPSAIEVNSHTIASAVTSHIQSPIELESKLIPTPEGPDSHAAHASRTDTEQLTLRSLLVRPVLLTIVNYAFLAFTDQCLVVLQPLMYSSSISVGGLGFTSFTIGIIMGIWGIINGIVSIFAFPKILRRFGIRRLYIVSFASYLVCLAAFPIMSIFVKRSGSVDAKVWIILIVQLIFYILAYMGYGECYL